LIDAIPSTGWYRRADDTIHAAIRTDLLEVIGGHQALPALRDQKRRAVTRVAM
jgi:hypothetical protein